MLVSVVIPAFNASRTLAETLASALSQTHAEVEVLVVDDGSSDDTARVARGAGDDRVRVLSVPNGGVARARNRGIREARGDLIAFLDADDVWRPRKLERQVEVMRAEPRVGICTTRATRIDDQSRPLGALLTDTGADDYCEALLLQSMVAGCISSGVVRRAALEQAGGFDPAFSQSADWDLWLRLSLLTSFVVLDDDLVLYRTSAQNMSANIELLERDTFAVLDKFYSDPAAAPYAGLKGRAYCNHWMICSGSYLHAGQIGSSLRCLVRGIRAYPAGLAQPLGLPARWIRRVRAA